MKRVLLTLGLVLCLWSPTSAQDFEEDLSGEKKPTTPLAPVTPLKKDALRVFYVDDTAPRLLPVAPVDSSQPAAAPFRRLVLELKNSGARKNLILTVTSDSHFTYQYSDPKDGLVVAEAQLTRDEEARIYNVFRAAEVVTLPEGVEDVRGLSSGSLVRIQSFIGNDVYEFNATLGYYKDYASRIRPLITTLVEIGKSRRPAKTAETVVAACGKVHPNCPKCNSTAGVAHIIYGFTSNSGLKGPCEMRAGGTARGFESWYCQSCNLAFEDESDKRVHEAVMEKRLRDREAGRGK